MNENLYIALNPVSIKFIRDTYSCDGVRFSCNQT